MPDIRKDKSSHYIAPITMHTHRHQGKFLNFSNKEATLHIFGNNNFESVTLQKTEKSD